MKEKNQNYLVTLEGVSEMPVMEGSRRLTGITGISSDISSPIFNILFANFHSSNIFCFLKKDTGEVQEDDKYAN